MFNRSRLGLAALFAAFGALPSTISKALDVSRGANLQAPTPRGRVRARKDKSGKGYGLRAPKPAFCRAAPRLPNYKGHRFAKGAYLDRNGNTYTPADMRRRQRAGELRHA